MAVYAIGDVQGCFEELRTLLDTIGFNKDKDKLWFCGDLVNRGPDSLRTLEYIYSLRDNVVTVLGNHDLHLLATYFHHRKPGRKDTLDSLINSPNAEPLMQWLRNQPLIHHDAELGIYLVHAAIHPSWSMATALELAAEVEAVITSDKHVEFYRHMYGDKPHYWSENLKSWPRLRYITNILTRLRYMAPDLKVSLNAKGAPGSQLQGSTPWFDIPDRASANDRIIFGHWSTLSLVEREYHNVYPLDTGCLWGGKLTALKIDSEEFEWLSIDCEQQQEPG